MSKASRHGEPRRGYTKESLTPRGYESYIVMPDDVAVDKVNVLQQLGAKVERVRPVSIVDENQFVVSCQL